MRWQVSDDSGFLALVDPDAYHGHVGPDWTPEELREVFVREMARRTLLIWGTGGEGLWTVEVALVGGGRGGERETTGGIVSTRGRLLVTNYESLTMAAQFSDVALPEEHQVGQLFVAPAGGHRCRIFQTAGGGVDAADFVIEVEAADGLPAPWTEVPWSGALPSDG